MNKPKVIVILGTTASGKTILGVKLARKFTGEIVSADSRQVFCGLDVGTGKDLDEYFSGGVAVPYHLIDVINPSEEFNLAKYKKLTDDALADILARGKLPIIVGGSGLYLQAVVDNYQIAPSRPNLARRQALEALNVSALLALLKKIKPDFAAKLNNSDQNNPRRLIRYIEVIESGEQEKIGCADSPYDFLLLGLTWPDEILRERIIRRLKERFDKENLIGEVEDLQANGLSWQRLISFGLEYKFISWYLLGKLDYSSLIEKLANAIYHFAKRQKTWFKRWEKQGREIVWVETEDEAVAAIKKFLK